jgi:hypothetical protein
MNYDAEAKVGNWHVGLVKAMHHSMVIISRSGVRVSANKWEDSVRGEHREPAVKYYNTALATLRMVHTEGL